MQKLGSVELIAALFLSVKAVALAFMVVIVRCGSALTGTDWLVSQCLLVTMALGAVFGLYCVTRQPKGWESIQDATLLVACIGGLLLVVSAFTNSLIDFTCGLTLFAVGAFYALLCKVVPR